jgi:chaperone BCS1
MRNITTARSRKCSVPRCASCFCLNGIRVLSVFPANIPRRKFFADCGIPYRRGYLFYGPPGTGKSSFSAALAGYLGCDIYHIALASGDIDDSRLHRLFLGLPRKCVVVIEDIDSAGIGREEEPSSTLNGMGPMPMLDATAMAALQKPRRKNPVTLSGLLNAIDGNASQEVSLKF